jgi:hypothetical protein
MNHDHMGSWMGGWTGGGMWMFGIIILVVGGLLLYTVSRRYKAKR